MQKTLKYTGRKRKNWTLFFMALPLMLFVFAMKYVPLLGWYFSLIEYKVGKPIMDCTFVGLDNFRAMFKNPAFFRALTNTFIFSGIKYALLFVPPIFAILFNEIPNLRYRKVVQTMTTLPHFISWVIVYGLAYALFSTEGVVNKALLTLGMRTQSVMTDRNSVYVFQSALYLWKVLGWNSIIYVAAIAGIDPQLYEAASIDGAGHFKRALHITLPGILPTMLVLLLLGVANIISNGMDQYYLFQNPMNYNKIETLELYTYKQGMKLMDYSYASAVDIMKSLVSLTLLFTTNAIAKKVRGNSIV